jgi:DNA-3-methyladenine glycosylase
MTKESANFSKMTPDWILQTSPDMVRLEKPFFLRPADVVARELLGKYLCVRQGEDILIVRLTETEAYMGVNDRACHSYGCRRTARTRVMYMEGGHLYVYFIYGMHCCVNIVTGEKDDPCAVLLRGAEVAAGNDIIARRRFGMEWNSLTPKQNGNS